jgi:hypothetical protein
MNKDTRATWVELLGAPDFSWKEFELRPTSVGVGFAGQSPISVESSSARINLIRADKSWFNVSWVGLIVLLVLTIYLVRCSDILRDSGPQPSSTNQKTGLSDRKPYSLARCNLAFWFFTIVVTFLFIFLITDGLDISATALALIGISGTTFLAAALVDSNTDAVRPVTVDNLSTRRSTLAAELNEINSKISVQPTAGVITNTLDAEAKNKGDQIKEIDAKITEIKKPTVSVQFLHDILTDSTNSYSLHRFQMFVWSIVMWVVFLHSVWHDLAMPEFSATLLGMMGISNATYLGFKVPESSSKVNPKNT